MTANLLKQNCRFVIEGAWCHIPVMESLCHLGSLWNDVRSGRASREEDVWKRVLDVQSFPVLSYGGHLMGSYEKVLIPKC